MADRSNFHYENLKGESKGGCGVESVNIDTVCSRLRKLEVK